MRNFIIGSDWWTDCDDAIAFRILARAAKSGQINIKGIILNACMKDSASSIISFLRSEGIDDLPPVGIDREATDFIGHPPYQQRLANLCVPRIENEDLEDATDLYIRLLKEAKDKLEIIEIGFPQVLAQVLTKEPKLFEQKVKKVWMMAGKWDVLPGKENNFCQTKRASSAANIFCKNCPVPVVFLGWEVSNEILTGGKLDKNDVLYQVLSDHGSIGGRSSWDPMLVTLALIGDPEKAGYSTITGTASVDPLTGENYFEPHENGKHCYVKKERPDEYYQKYINNLIASK